MRTLLSNQRGFLVAYVSYAIAVLAALGVAYGKMSSAKTQAEVISNAVDTLEAGVLTLYSRIETCASDYPTGNHGEFSLRQNYPAPPTAQSNRDTVSNAICPGAPLANQSLSRFGYLPQTPGGFNEWEYQHTAADGVRIILVPTAVNGEATVRHRLKTRLSNASFTYADGTDGELIITLVPN